MGKKGYPERAQMFEVEAGQIVGTGGRRVPRLADSCADLVLGEGHEGWVEFVYAMEIPHNLPGASIRFVRRDGRELCGKFFSDCVGFVMRLVIERDGLVGRGADVFTTDLPDDGPEFLCVSCVVAAADVL